MIIKVMQNTMRNATKDVDLNDVLRHKSLSLYTCSSGRNEDIQRAIENSTAPKHLGHRSCLLHDAVGAIMLS